MERRTACSRASASKRKAKTCVSNGTSVDAAIVLDASGPANVDGDGDEVRPEIAENERTVHVDAGGHALHSGLRLCLRMLIILPKLRPTRLPIGQG